MVALPKRPEPEDWLKAAATELHIGDKATLKLLQEAYREVNKSLKDLPDDASAPLGALVQRAQAERVRRELLSAQAKLFDKLGDLVSARRLRSASRAAKLSAAADAALLNLVGEGETGKKLYDGADITAQRTVETILARIGLSKVPLSQRIYDTNAWMNGRLDKLIAGTMAQGLNAKRFAKIARDWFSPSVPGGTRYAAMRLARTEINNAFHATSIDYAQSKPWVSEMEWVLSKSHTTPDKCNEYAAASPWPVHAIPRKPHPQCMCTVAEVTPDEDDWIDRFVKGEFDDYLDAELAKADGKSPQATKTATGKPIQEQTAPPVNRDAPSKPKTDGYEAGKWNRIVDNEAEIAEMEKSIVTLVPKDQQAKNLAKDGPDWARKLAETFVAGTKEDSEVAYRNGPHRIRFTGTHSKDFLAHQKFLGEFDFMQTKYPTGHNMRIQVAPSTQFQYGVGGETTVSTGSMFINENVLTREVWPGMPVSDSVSSSQYVLAHEWGHSLSTKEEAYEHEVHNHAIEAGGLTRYGTSGADGVLAPAEGYAEAFAEWALTQGTTTNPAAIEYAKRFKWGERFGIH